MLRCLLMNLVSILRGQKGDGPGGLLPFAVIISLAAVACSDALLPIAFDAAVSEASAPDLLFVDVGSSGDIQGPGLADGLGEGSPSDSTDGAIPLILTPPTGLATVVGREAVALNWVSTKKLPTESFTIYWSKTPGIEVLTATKVANVQSGHIVEGLENGVATYFAVSRSRFGLESKLSAEVEATPEGDFVPVFVGSGGITNFATKQMLQLPVENRVHLLMLPEGYLASELAQFDTDIQEWLTAIWKVDIYSLHRNALVVWKLPQASTQHVAAGSPQSAQTAFAVPLTTAGTGVGTSGFTATAAKIWAAVGTFHYPTFGYYGSGGRTSYLAKNIVPHILVFNPAKGKSGMSGRTVTLTNPEDSKQKLSTAIAMNLAHEFTHAFGRLGDEYLDDNLGNLGQSNALMNESRYLHNVVKAPTCDDLPWKHLLVGSTINPTTDQLVGAFGNATNGYHSELKCLMNGTHDNKIYYGGNGSLRTSGRLCNFCRELLTFRIYERTAMLPDPTTSYATWVATYRQAFYDAFAFQVPGTVPQENSNGEAKFEACVP